MSARLRVEPGAGDHAFPVALGGDGIALPGWDGREAVGWLGLDGADVFVQPADPLGALSCNGAALTASRWLRDGDTLRAGAATLTFRATAAGPALHVTRDAAPPAATASPAPAAPAAPGARIHPLDFQPRALAEPRATAGGTSGSWAWIALGALALLVAFGAWTLGKRGGVTPPDAAPAPSASATPAATPEPTPSPTPVPTPSPAPEARQGPDAATAAATRLPATGRFALASEPSGASVTVDGAFRGRTPLELELPSGRTHALQLSLQAHETARLEVSLARGESRSETVPLVPLLGEVALDVRPADAEVRVDGVPRGRSGETLQLPARPHEFEVRRDGHEAQRVALTPQPGFPQVLKVALKPAGEAARPEVLRGAGGHELRLVRGLRFATGASRREPGRRANEVQREVEITRPYYIGLREVTNGEFRRFRPGHSSGALERFSLDTDDLPVVRVSWEDAAAYCNWLSEQEGRTPAYVAKGGTLVAASPPGNGYRLPTEAEWTRAARYPAGTPLKYPWGAALPVAARSGNYADESARGLLPAVIPGYDDGFAAAAPPGRFPANPLGLFDTGGNVAEWVHDVYAIPAPNFEKDPMGPPEGALHVILGASYLHATVTELRLSFRDYSATARPDVGFRVARPAE